MNVKKLVGEKASEYIEDGMIVGLGTGSTAYYFVEAVGKMVSEGLHITGVTTSIATQKQAEGLGIPLKSVDEVDHIDLTVDGADEVAPDFSGIKGGGGALLFEKIVAKRSEKVIWIVDDSKMVDQLGAFPLPVEVVCYGADRLFNDFKEKGFKPKFRMKDGERYLTDSHHYIIDLDVFPIENPVELGTYLKSLTGVVEHGLFTNLTETVLVGKENHVEILSK
ncbi:ribose-5-phosphate isomerase [Granulicatella balaenopterae]|uniref:Ribose-5-phosphate isomerase A n=1 Tax=Granulicatella balaenopterae TaxID=137733 RepID=A0A1H9N0P8_9LACT|nr:ribose-5-phosphate isomerase RpiA [Granulicatella balaenopterae]SER29512.1 ribose-5-phosphate isomerase [Granulicatella balaenopterae]